MTPADRIIAKFGSLRAVARALGHRHPSTIQGWKERGYVPMRHAPAILAASAELPDPVTPDDFIPERAVEGHPKAALSKVGASA